MLENSQPVLPSAADPDRRTPTALTCTFREAAGPLGVRTLFGTKSSVNFADEAGVTGEGERGQSPHSTLK
jgi:hypothetical protein